eukprot:1319204-Amphidinium_carterae.1
MVGQYPVSDLSWFWVSTREKDFALESLRALRAKTTCVHKPYPVSQVAAPLSCSAGPVPESCPLGAHSRGEGVGWRQV